MSLRYALREYWRRFSGYEQLDTFLTVQVVTNIRRKMDCVIASHIQMLNNYSQQYLVPCLRVLNEHIYVMRGESV